MKKIISIVLISIMLLSTMPFTAFAGGDEIELELDTQYEVWVGEDVEIYRFTPTEDGWYKFYTVGDCDTYATLYNSNWDEIDFADDSDGDTNFSLNYKLYSGYTYYLEVGAYVEETQVVKFNLFATETVGVEDAYISKEPDNMNCIIGYEYESIDLFGMEVTFTLSDGEKYLWSYNNGGNVLGFYVDYSIDSDGYGNYYVEVVCGEGYDRLMFDMIENPVESISVESMSAIELYENSSGYFSDEGYYHYQYAMPEDAKIRIKYIDGTESVVNYHDQPIDGFYFECDDEQYLNHWNVGENEFTIKYMGCTTTATVTILPCPYESVTLLSAPTREYIYGDFSTGYIYDGDYVLCPDDLTGLSFELGYSDGTTEIIDEDNIDMSLTQIDGYMYEIGEYLVAGAGNVQVTLSYKGMDITYSVKVVENPIDSVEVLKAPDKHEYEDRYHADYTGMEIKVNFKDGTNETVVFTEENMTYELNGSLYCYVPVGDYKLSILRQFDLNSEKYYTTVVCLGVMTDYYGIEYTESREVEGITKVENFTYNTDGMTIYVEYKDGTEETLTYSPVDYYDYGDDMYEGFAYTDNGITYFDTSLKTKDETATVYTLYTLEKSTEVTVPNFKLGDVDGDGKVSIMDATAIQRHIAQLESIKEDRLPYADTDKDGKVSIMDATMIQRLIAQLITEF
ncbi:MAG: dockerin type I repeat-containing protein [Ruminococcus sp.]|nr:dockerin type I repeat-containing protein [Ruminococcus sp.]